MAWYEILRTPTMGSTATDPTLAAEIDAYRQDIERLTSLHLTCMPPVDWVQIRQTPEPILEPAIPEDPEVTAARRTLEGYRPGCLARLLGLEANERGHLIRTLHRLEAEAMEHARTILEAAQQEHTEWSRARVLAVGILQRRFEAYADVIDAIDPFAEVREAGFGIDIFPNQRGNIVAITLIAPIDLGAREIPSVVDGHLFWTRPTQKEHLRLRARIGYSAAVRVAREVFALLSPVDFVLVNLVTPEEDWPTHLAVVFGRDDLAEIDHEVSDPEATIRTFPHRLTEGDGAVPPFTFDEV